MDPDVELHVEPGSERFDASDDRWLDQVGAFRSELARDVGGVRLAQTPVEGTKGLVDSILLSVGSAGGLTVAVEFFKAWLQRDDTRSLTVSWHESGTVHRIELTGRAVDDSVLQRLVGGVGARVTPPPTGEAGP